MDMRFLLLSGLSSLPDQDMVRLLHSISSSSLKPLKTHKPRLEKKIAKSEEIDAETLNRVMHSPIFKVACLVVRDIFGLKPSYEFSEQEKIEIARILLRDGGYGLTPNDLVLLIIEMDKKARIEEEGSR
jgi:hypothetical protein